MTSERYQVILLDGAQRDGARIPSLKPRISKALLTLKERPDRGHPLAGPLSGCRSLVLSHSQGGYRAVYLVQAETCRCFILAIGPHATVYDVAARRYATLGDEI